MIATQITVLAENIRLSGQLDAAYRERDAARKDRDTAREAFHRASCEVDVLTLQVMTLTNERDEARASRGGQ